MTIHNIRLFILRHEAACWFAGYFITSILAAGVILYVMLHWLDAYIDTVAEARIPHVYKQVEEERAKRIVAEAGSRDAMRVLQGDALMIEPIDGMTAKVANVQWSKPRTLLAGLEE